MVNEYFEYFEFIDIHYIRVISSGKAQRGIAIHKSYIKPRFENPNEESVELSTIKVNKGLQKIANDIL